MKGSKTLRCGTQEDPSDVRADLLLGPVRVERALVRLAQAPRRPVEPLGFPQPLAGGHGAVSGELLGGWPIHEHEDSTYARARARRRATPIAASWGPRTPTMRVGQRRALSRIAARVQALSRLAARRARSAGRSSRSIR